MKHRLAAVVPLALLALVATPAGAQTQAWVRQIGTSGMEHPSASAPDGSGGLYLCGMTDGVLGAANLGQKDAWLARYDNAGNQIWIRQLGTAENDEARGAASDGSGGVYVTGYTMGSLGALNAGETDAWLARYDSAGNQTWIRQFGTTGFENAKVAVPDGSGGVILGGAVFDGGLAGPSAGEEDAWLARFDNAGNQIWIRQFGTSAIDSLNAAAPDASGGIFITGYTYGNLGGPITGVDDVWLARYDALGQQSWIRQFGTSSYEEPTAAAADGAGGVFVGGNTNGNFAGPNSGGNDSWLARYDSSGSQTWIRQFGTSGNEGVSAAVLDGSGGAYVFGGTTGSLAGPSVGGGDAWLAHYDASGSQNWAQQLGTTSTDDAYVAASDGASGFYVSGNTSGSLGGTFAGGTWDVWLARYETSGVATVYCTAKVNSLACTPTIGWSGSPTTSGPVDDFNVIGANVLNRKPGIMLWSTQPAATPLGGGTLCLAPPIVRTPGQSSGGSPAPANDCTGQYLFHFGHVYVQSSLLGVGQTIRAQYWSRDPGFIVPNNIGLTDGLSFTLLP